MAKTLLYRMFGLGKIPRRKLPALEDEGILFAEEGVGGSVTYEKWWGAGRATRWRRSSFSGSVVLTRTRFGVYGYLCTLFEIPAKMAHDGTLQCDVEESGRVVLSANGSDLNPKWRGTITFRLRLDEPEEFLASLRSWPDAPRPRRF